MTKEELIKNQFPNDEFLQSAVLQIVDRCVAELEKENAELKAKIYGGGYEAIYTKLNADIFLLEKQNKEFKNKLAKAKEIILKLYNAGRDVLMCRNEELAYTRLDNAINDKRIEQFLSEVEHD